MAEYPEGNPGVWPIEPDTAIGRFRLIYGDTQATAYVPDEPGYRNYRELSDAEIEAYLAQGNGSTYRALGYYYLALAGKAALVSEAIKDYDLAVDNSKRPAELRAIAQQYFDLADDEDGDAEDAFLVVPMGGRGEAIAEGTIPQWGRVYTWGRV